MSTGKKYNNYNYLQIQDVSLADFSFDDRSDEVQFWRWATVITTAVCALSILLGIVLCCLMCCHDKKPKVTVRELKIVFKTSNHYFYDTPEIAVFLRLSKT